MFGGSAKARETDDKYPIRAAAIRGHLRFWWRATAGAAAKDSVELFKMEEQVWGSTSIHGQVSLYVSIKNAGEKQSHSSLSPKPDAKIGPQEGVFLFPFQAGRDVLAQPEAFGRKSVLFELVITAPSDYLPSIRRALKAWIAFGGVGSRTRRGCGAVQPVNNESIAEWMPPGDQNLQRWLNELAGALPSGSPEWTTLTGANLVYGAETSAEKAWSDLGRFWSRFRKGHFTESHPAYNPMDGCQWQDHGTLRRFRGEETIALAKPMLGLPTIYQDFPPKGNKPRTFSGTLESEETSRMASPVIIKPVCFANGRVRPVVIVMRAPQPKAIRIDKQLVQLKAPSGDPVLASLGGRSALTAAILAAKAHFNGALVKVGAQ